MSLPKEQRPHGLKAAIILVVALIVVLKVWKNRDEIAAHLEKLAHEAGTKLGLGDDEKA